MVIQIILTIIFESWELASGSLTLVPANIYGVVKKLTDVGKKNLMPYIIKSPKVSSEFSEN